MHVYVPNYENYNVYVYITRRGCVHARLRNRTVHFACSEKGEGVFNSG